ncbi:unnamed protein product, partial [Ectocarpus sp. 12 AP-2014]
LSAPKVLTSLAFVSLAAVAATAHVRTMLTNPGAVPRDAAPPPPPDSGGEGEGEGGVNNRGGHLLSVDEKCRCDAFKPARAHHCSLCQRCIVKMDHHCPWVNNCVGIGNQKLFLLFCAYTCALCV